MHSFFENQYNIELPELANNRLFGGNEVQKAFSRTNNPECNINKRKETFKKVDR